MNLKLHVPFMKECLCLSDKAMESGNVPYSALVVKNGVVLAASYNRVLEHNDPIAHAEMVTIRDALCRHTPSTLVGATLYSSNEPCPMCVGAAIWCGFSIIVYGARQELRVSASERSYFVPPKEICERDSADTKVIGPLMEDEFVSIHRAFWRSTKAPSKPVTHS